MLNRIGSQVPDHYHSYPYLEEGKIYYVRQWIGWFLEGGGLLSLPILFLLALITYFKSEKRR
jgi:hypothetical protein